MRRIIHDVEFKHLSRSVQKSLRRMLIGFAGFAEKEIEYFSQKAVGHLDSEETDNPYLIDKFGECVEMLERLAIDFRKEAERIRE